MDPYSTHLMPLVKTALETKGAILELGCGDYSTPLLREICRIQARLFVCQTTDGVWAEKVGGEIEVIPDWDTWMPPKGPWGMVFVDSDEGTWKRVKRIPLLAGLTKTVVLHDADVSMTRGAWPLAKEAFPIVMIYDKYKPWTAVMQC